MVTYSPPVVSKSGAAVEREPGACSFTFSAHSGTAPDTPVDYARRQFSSRETKCCTTSSLFILPVMKGFGLRFSIGMREAGSRRLMGDVHDERVGEVEAMSVAARERERESTNGVRGPLRRRATSSLRGLRGFDVCAETLRSSLLLAVMNKLRF